METLDEFLVCMFGYYDKKTNCISMNVYRRMLKDYPFEEIGRAFRQHITDPDNGQFMPKIADFARIIDGTKRGNAVIAWSKIIAAIKIIGPYNTFTIDDEWAMQAIDEIGGFQKLCEMSEKELDYKMNEFNKVYESIRGQGPAKNYAATIRGLIDTNNGTSSDPFLIGDVEKAKIVQKLGSRKSQLKITAPKKVSNLLENFATAL